MASIYKRGRIWWAKFQHQGQVLRRSLQTPNRQLARERARHFECTVRDGTPVNSETCTRTPLDAALQEFCEHQRVTKTQKSAQTDIYYLRQVFGPACPAMLVNARKPISEEVRQRRLALMSTTELRTKPNHLRPRRVEQLTTEDVSRTLVNRVRQRNLSPKTGNRLREVVHRFCQWCISQRGIRFPADKNPVTAVERFRERTGTIRFLTIDQVHAQLEALEQSPVIRAMVAVYIYAGLRREEALWLTHEDVDLQARMIRVQAKRIGGTYWEPKTKRNRAVPISGALLKILAQYRPVVGTPWYFTSPKGCQWDPDNCSRALRRINRAAGLPWSCLDYRHTFGSHMAQRGVSLYKISELMGNSPEICRRHYAALVPEQMADAVEFDAMPVDSTGLKLASVG